MKKNEPRAIDILEQAVNLLRSNPSAWIFYLAGAIPFLIAMLFFLNDMMLSPFAFDHLGEWSLGLAALYIWKNTWQAMFAARLHRALSPGESQKTFVFRSLLIQCALQPVGLAVPVPLPWLTGFFRNAAMFTAIGAPDALRTARRQAMLWSRQTTAILLFVSLASLILLVNMFAMVVIIPQLARSFLGIEGGFARAGEHVVSWSTFGAAAGLTWLLIDPLLDAVFVVRCYYGQSVATGEDLRAGLSKILVTAAMVLCLIALAPRANAQTPPPSNQPAQHEINPTELDRSIDQVIQSREFTWRNPRTIDENEAKWVGWVRTAVKTVVDFIVTIIAAIFSWLNPRRASTDEVEGSPASSRALKTMIGVLVALVAGAAIAFFLRRRAPVTKAVAVAAATSVNVADESVTADELPESSWLRLADELLEQGDCRLALRALHLAGLKYLGERNLVSIRKWKSGLDYRRELDRRARSKAQVAPEISPVFSSNVDLFERGWYGRRPVDREMVEAFAARLTEIRNYAR